MMKLTMHVRAMMLLLIAVPVLSWSGAGAATALAAEKPNILLILADDLGFSDLGCYGGEIQTPHLDSLAANGLKFTQFYNTARCWPTRGALLTGYYAQQIRRDTLPGVPSGGGNRGQRPEWAVLLPKMLAPQGYRSYHTGKWHIDGMPVEQGFDRSYYLRDQGRFFNPTKHWKDDVALPPVEKGTDYYATTALANHAIEVLTEHEKEHADSPFFHYLAFAAPHFPLQAPAEDIAIYDEVYQKGWDVVRQQRWQRMRGMGLLDEEAVSELSRVERTLGPPYHFPNALKTLGAGEINKPVPWSTLTKVQQDFQAKKMAIHAAMIHRMDLEIGRVLEKIKAMGEWENTMVVFLSDNGASAEIMVRDDGHDPALPAGSAGTYLCLGPGWSTTSNTPFRRHKTWTHEGGISTPLLVSWPAGIAARGEIRRTPGHVIDVVPTLLELTGGQPVGDAPKAPGKSLTPLFVADEGVDHDALWWYHDDHRAIRVGDWKAVSPAGEPWELYDLSQDRDESTDLAIGKRDKLNELTALWESMLAEITETATADLPAKVLEKVAAAQTGNAGAMSKAKADALPKRRQVLLNGETLMIEGRYSFIMHPEEGANADGKPWIFYGPTLSGTPDKSESWMHERFLKAGIAVAGIDIGEGYGSPAAFPFFEALYQEMVTRGFSKTPVLLGRSRGGLWVSSWALKHPDRVAGIAGIYPVYDYTSYPGVERAAPIYGLTPEELLAKQDELNPIRRGAELAKAKIPVFIIHGKIDKVVALEKNSAALEEIYRSNGAGDLIEVVKIDDQGHNYWPGFFQHQPLVDFVIRHAGGKVRP